MVDALSVAAEGTREHSAHRPLRGVACTPREGRRPPEGEAAFEEGGVVVYGLSGRLLPQHVNGGGSVHGGSVAAKLSVQPVDIHGTGSRPAWARTRGLAGVSRCGFP